MTIQERLQAQNITLTVERDGIAWIMKNNGMRVVRSCYMINFYYYLTDLLPEADRMDCLAYLRSL